MQQQVPWPTLLANAGSTVDTFSASLLLREGGTQTLKSTLRPALHSRSGEVCTVDASIAEQLHLEIGDSFSYEPLVFGRLFFSRRQTSAS